MKKYYIITIFFLLISNQVMAKESSWFSNAQISTLGPGINVGKKISDNLAIRANINGMSSFNKNIYISDIKYNTKLKLNTAGLLLDYYYYDGFRVSMGVYYNRNKIETSATEFKMGKNKYDGSSFGKFEASGHFNRFSPYLGLGYQTMNKKGWNVSTDIGVMYHGKFSSNGKLSCYAPICNKFYANNPNIVEDEKKNFDDKINKYKFYPVISFGLVYVF